MRRKVVKLIILMILVTIIPIITGCGYNKTSKNNSSVTISISGSSSVGPLMESIQEVYEEKNNNIILEIQQNGSGAGIKDVMMGVSEIGMSSRDLKGAEEVVQGIPIAYDGIALLVNKNNYVKNLTLQEIKKIYTGEIKNWKDLGGEDAPIVVISREEGSGTRDTFQEIIGYKSEELIKNASISDGSGAVKTTVVGNKNAIGFASFEYIDDTVAALSVDGVEANSKNVKEGNYKISRAFLLVTKKDTLTQDGQNLIDFILSPQGQQIVSDNKLITVN